jgi:hypothetical protein
MKKPRTSQQLKASKERWAYLKQLREKLDKLPEKFKR